MPVIDYQRPQASTRVHGLYLIECPFCGRAPKVETTGEGIKIECRAFDCKAQASVIAPTEREAVSLWNRRR